MVSSRIQLAFFLTVMFFACVAPSDGVTQTSERDVLTSCWSFDLEPRPSMEDLPRYFEWLNRRLTAQIEEVEEILGRCQSRSITFNPFETRPCNPLPYSIDEKPAWRQVIAGTPITGDDRGELDISFVRYGNTLPFTRYRIPVSGVNLGIVTNYTGFANASPLDWHRETYGAVVYEPLGLILFCELL